MVVKASMLGKEWLFAGPYAAQGKFEKENLSAKAAQLTDFFIFFIFNRTLANTYCSLSQSCGMSTRSRQLFSLGRWRKMCWGGAGAALLKVPSHDGWELRILKPCSYGVGTAQSSNTACSPWTCRVE